MSDKANDSSHIGYDVRHELKYNKVYIYPHWEGNDVCYYLRILDWHFRVKIFNLVTIWVRYTHGP